MKLKEVYKATNLDEALEILNNNTVAKIIAGGTDLIVHIKGKKFDKEVLVDISDIKELRFIEEKDGYIEIGSCTTFNDIINSNVLNINLYGLKKAASLVGSPQIRSRGTVGGNICNASPSADLIPPLLVLDTIAVIKCIGYTREVKVEELLIDKNKINIKENEILTSVKFKLPQKNQVLSFTKLGIRKSLSISRVSNSVFLEVENHKYKDIKIASGAVGKICEREYELERQLIGNEIDEDISQALNFIEDSIGKRLQGRDSKEFKSIAIKGVLKQCIEDAINLYESIN